MGSEDGSADRVDSRSIYAYSAYHQVRPKGLAGLFASADSDDRVDRSNPSSCAEANADHGGPTSAAAG